MATRQTPDNPDPGTGPLEGGQGVGGLAEMLASLLGAAGARESKAAPRGQAEQSGGGQEGGLDEIVARLFSGGGTEAGQQGEGLSPELLKAVMGAQAAGGTAAVPDALKRALEALGVSPVLLEKVLPAILARLPALTQAEKKPAPARQVRKSTPKAKTAPAKTTPAKPAPAKTKPAKPAQPATKPAGSGSKSKPASTGTASGKSAGTGSKSSRSTGSGSGTGRSSSRSSGTSKARKPAGESEGLNLDDLLENLTK